MANKLWMLISVFLLVSACKKDKTNNSLVDNSIDLTKITLTTKEGIVRENGSILSGGKASIDLSKYKNLDYGICFANYSNPTLNDEFFFANSASGGDFDAIVSEDYRYDLNEAVYIRAFVRDTSNNSIKYGNQVKVEQTYQIEINEIRDISVNSFVVDFTLSSLFRNADQSGYVFGLSSNPTLGSYNHTIYLESNKTGKISLSTDVNNDAIITPGEIHYVRAFAILNGKTYYSEQKEVTLAGYNGPAGGIVIYDKGKVVDGWRYLEAAPAYLEYTYTNQYGIIVGLLTFIWACDEIENTSLNTDTKIGSGYENTLTIRGHCNFNDNAAAVANAVKVNGTDKWFLPSVDEFKLLHRAQQYDLVDLNVNPFDPEGNIFWTSSQVNSSYAYAVKHKNTSSMQVIQLDKMDYGYVWQVRKF